MGVVVAFSLTWEEGANDDEVDDALEHVVVAAVT